ncbi:MAG: hypothetical protein OXR66_08045 [Candidatus Woesearchaeota archaeon]|nr:hypothetical protein [Candidatus Woesearchaeota archaeon]
MSTVRNMFNEVQYELVKLILLDVFLSTVIVFLIADLIALVFNMPLWYVIVLSVVYFGIVFYFETQKISWRQVEKDNPELQEIFRTARDNMDDDSLMAHALFHDVLTRMRHISSGSFLDFKQLMVRLGIIFALSIILISIAFFNVNIARFDNPLQKPISALGGLFGKGDAGTIDGVAIGDADDDIFGDARLATLGADQLVATVNPSLNSPDFSQVDDPTLNNDPLADLGQGDNQFNAPGSTGGTDGLDERDLERSYNYAKSIQG